MIRRAEPAIDLAARLVEQRYGLRVPGAPHELRIIDRATGAIVGRLDVHSNDGVEARLRDDLQRLDAVTFAGTWCTGAERPGAEHATRDAAAKARLRADLRLVGGLAALTVIPLARRVLRHRRADR